MVECCGLHRPGCRRAAVCSRNRNMKNENVRFSIVIPVFNAAGVISNMMNSILEQDWKNYEIILVDDGSTDGTPVILEALEKSHPEIQVHTIEPLGALAAREYGLSMASGDYVLFFDADDSIEPGMLSFLAEKIGQENPDMIVYGMNRIVDGQAAEHPDIEKEETVTDRSELFLRMMTDNSMNPMWRKCIRRSVIPDRRHEEDYGTQYGEDLLQSLDILGAVSKTLFVPERLYNYYLNPNGVTSSISADNYRIDYTVRLKVLDYLEKNQIFDAEQVKIYRGYVRRLIYDQLKRIARFRTGYRKKKELYQEIYDSEYFQDFVADQPYDPRFLGKREKVVDLFEEGKIIPVLLAMNFLEGIRS